MTVQRHDDRDRQRRYDSAECRRHTTSDAIERRSPTMTPWYPSRRPVRRLVAAGLATGTVLLGGALAAAAPADAYPGDLMPGCVMDTLQRMCFLMRRTELGKKASHRP